MELEIAFLREEDPFPPFWAKLGRTGFPLAEVAVLFDSTGLLPYTSLFVRGYLTLLVKGKVSDPGTQNEGTG